MGAADNSPKVGCDNCGAPYGEDGWCDVVIPNEIWNTIAPNGGLLCFRCMTKIILTHGLDHVPVIVASGPYRDANEEWRLIGLRHGEANKAKELADLRRLAGELAGALKALADRCVLSAFDEALRDQANTAIASAAERGVK